ncbi:hypothetical protein ACE41H_21575 [Paenibacillus enshidis]|uniref:Toprim domain-containing protein n=1 Tax=Paenibacillus enshidis TaxID=1458439 RepID=A0ABV5AYR0_9BACL
MKVILAEKPSMGGDIASALGIAKREKGYITLQSGDVVTWAIGHIIQQKTPDTYPGYKEWNLENLPFVPDPILKIVGISYIPWEFVRSEKLEKTYICRVVSFLKQ